MCGSSPCSGETRGKVSSAATMGFLSSLGPLLLAQMTPVMLSSSWALLFGSYSKMFHREG